MLQFALRDGTGQWCDSNFGGALLPNILKFDFDLFLKTD